MASGKGLSRGKGKSRAKVEETDYTEDETQFEQHSEDDLYDVVEILNEKSNGMYLVRWAGVDPDGKPWKDSWVPRKDITDDLVVEWRKKKKQKQKDRQLKRKQSLSKRSKSRLSETSLPSKPDSTSTTLTGPPKRVSSTNVRKRKKSTKPASVQSGTDKDEPNLSPRKRQRLSSDIEIRPTVTSRPETFSVDRSVNGSPSPPKNGKRLGVEVAAATEEKEDLVHLTEEFEPPPALLRERTLIPEPIASSSKLPLDERQKTSSPSKWMSRNLKGSMKRRSRSSILRSETLENSRETQDESPQRQRSKSKSSKPLSDHPPSKLTKGRSHSVHSSRFASEAPNQEINDADQYGENETHNDLDDLPFSQVDDPHPTKEIRTSDILVHDKNSSKGTIVPESQSSQVPFSLNSEKPPSSQPLDSSTPQIGSSMEAQDGSHDLSRKDERSMKPIPMITPSKFKPHLPAVKPMKSVTQLIPSLQKNGGPLSSSIETDYSQRRRVNEEITEPANGTQEDEYPDEIEESSSLPLLERGRQLAEIHHQQKQETSETNTRKPLDAILLQRRSLSVAPPTMAMSSPPPEHTLQDEDAIVQHMEEQFMDLDGKADSSLLPIPSNGTPPATEDVTPRLLSSSQGVEISELAQPALSEKYESTDEENEDDVKSIAKSLSMDEGEGNVPEEDPFLTDDHHEISRPHTPTTTTSAQDHNLSPRTPRRRFEILGSPHKYLADVVKTPTLQLNSALGLLHQKSEEIADLKALISDGDDERRALLDRIAHLEAERGITLAERSVETPQDKERARLQASLDELRKTYEASVKDRDSLVAEIDLLKISRADAEKNASLFKELYSQASSYTDDLREENADLRSRLLLAESQVSKGIQLIRAQYSAQVTKLSAELEKSQLLLSVFEEKDRRTDDDVRRKAAREPELLARIEELREEYQEKKSDLDTVLRQRNDLLVEKQQLTSQIDAALSERLDLRKELRRLQVELARFSARERSIKKMIDLPSSLDQDADTDDDDDDPSEEEVFVCSWAIDDGVERCSETFFSRQDMQDHLFLVGHI